MLFAFKQVKFDVQHISQLKKYIRTQSLIDNTFHRSPVHMDAQYRLVETFDASNVSKVSLGGKTNDATVSGTPAKLWYRNGIVIGSYVETSTLNEIPCLGQLESAVINRNKLRQLAAGQTEGGSDIGGFYVISDVAGVWLLKDPKNASKWAKQIDRTLAPSLVWIDSGKGDVSMNGVSVVYPSMSIT